MGTSILYFHPHGVGREPPETDTGDDATDQKDLTLTTPFYSVINYQYTFSLAAHGTFSET